MTVGSNINATPSPLSESEIHQNLDQNLYQLITKMYPICRSITGDGIRKTLQIIQQYIPLEIQEVPSSTQVFDWTVPKEWNIKDAYIKNAQGEKVVDFNNSNLHVVSYSVPVHQKVTLAELQAHLHTLPENPEWIPYRTSYYKENWGFCLSHQDYLALQDPEYEVCIDSSLEPGSLTYGEYYLPGETSEEVLFSCHACHPSLCNDNLSGISIAVFLAQHLSTLPKRRYSYRFLFIPVTIGSITWLSLNQEKAQQIKHGLVLSCLGDRGKSTYKKSRQGEAEIDQAVIHVLHHSGQDYDLKDFLPYGYDERQYCSPGFNLPVGSLLRTPNGCYPEYHTSADNLDFVDPDCLVDSFSKCLSVIEVLEHNRVYFNQNPYCEPQLGKRGLYRAISGQKDGGGVNQLAILWVLNLSDGHHSLLDIANRANMPFSMIKKAADALIETDLLKTLKIEN